MVSNGEKHEQTLVMQRLGLGGMRRVSGTGFHQGELAVQRRAGVSADAARLEGMLAPGYLGGGAHKFLADRTFAVLTGHDDAGSLWSSPLVGAAGFLEGAGNTLAVGIAPQAGDPLAELPVGQPVGMLAIDFATRRRMRVNGVLTGRSPAGLRIRVEQAYGNCPQYIQQRLVEPTVGIGDRVGSGSAASGGVTAAQVGLIRGADTFFLGTTHPDRGRDASHRGGPAGFVRVESAALWWPDYPGNNMFNSLGNLAVDPAASLLFVDFGSGETVQLSGIAELEWDEPGSPGDDGRTGRRIRFTPDQIAPPAGSLPIRAHGVRPWPRNPAVTG